MGKKLIDIPRCPGYKISNTGAVFNSKGEKLNGQINNHGRRMITLYGLSRQVSRLVAISFISNPQNYPCVLHNDNNPLNNHYKNLRWGTNKMNSQQMVKDGRANGGTKKVKLTNDAVQEIRLSKVDNWELANLYDVSYSHIVSIKNGRRRNNI